MLDDEIIEHFRAEAERKGFGYQTLINAQLRAVLLSSRDNDSEPLTVAKLREVLRHELSAA